MPEEIRSTETLVCSQASAKVREWNSIARNNTELGQHDCSHWERSQYSTELEKDIESASSAEDLLYVILHAIRELDDASTQDLIRFIRQGASATQIAQHASFMLARDTQRMHDRFRSLCGPKL